MQAMYFRLGTALEGLFWAQDVGFRSPWGEKMATPGLRWVSLRVQERLRGPAEAEKWARFRPRVGATALAKDPAYLFAAFHARRPQRLI